MWVLVVVLLVALMIPTTAILLDSPLGRSFARRLDGQGDGGGAGGGAGVRKLEQRVEALETDLEDLNRSIDSIPADAFRAALRIPNTIRSLLGEGTLLGSFIPVYAALNDRTDKRGARALAGAVLGLLLLGSGVLALLGIAFAPAITTALATGFD